MCDKSTLAAMLYIGLLLLTGCSESTTHGVVNGSVTLDGKPLEEGTVRFVPIEGESQTASAMITDGKFESEVPVGKVRVEYSAPKVMGKKKMYQTEDSPTVDIVGELLPERYNVRSEVVLSVEPGQNAHEIDLQSK